MSKLLGEPIYAMAKYPAINRITLPCGKNGILMITTETELETSEIIDQVLGLIEKFADSPQDLAAPSMHRYNF